VVLARVLGLLWADAAVLGGGLEGGGMFTGEVLRPQLCGSSISQRAVTGGIVGQAPLQGRLVEASIG
jgi:hypothetical protein